MSGFPEYDRFDACGLAALVRKKEISPFELYEEAARRIEKNNKKLNAVVFRMFDAAREQAQKSDFKGKFAGVPFLLKDLLASCAGTPMSNGCRSYRDVISERDSEMVRRFKKTGVNILGKTNTPEFGLMGVTEPELWGPSRNPWDTERTPGGSSGGSAGAGSRPY